MSLNEKLKVTIALQTPMAVPKDLLHLDALLGSLKVAQVKAEKGEEIDPREYHHNLPLARYVSSSGEWVFKASALRLQIENRQNFMMTSRINLSNAARHRESGWLKFRGNIPNIAGGPFKTSLSFVPVAFGVLTGYCVGSKAEIKKLLEGCVQVGGRRGTGWGRVKTITVESVSDANCKWFDRNLPIDMEGVESSHAIGISNLTAPYWDKTNYQKVLMPTS